MEGTRCEIGSHRRTQSGHLGRDVCKPEPLLPSLAMVAIHCTQKLLARIGAPAAETEPATTRLGDWHAKPVAVGHQRLILLVSERSRLPVVMWARGARQLTRNFPDALAAVLWGLGIDAAAINRELAETREAAIGKANDRSLLGTLNDFAFMLQWQLPDDSRLDLVRVAVELAHTPVQVSREGFFPDQVTRELLS
jgi:hypothetical protein